MRGTVERDVIMKDLTPVLRKRLRELIDLAKSKGCKVDPDAVVWANTAAPTSPVK